MMSNAAGWEGPLSAVAVRPAASTPPHGRAPTPSVPPSSLPARIIGGIGAYLVTKLFTYQLITWERFAPWTDQRCWPGESLLPAG